MTKIFIKKG